MANAICKACNTHKHVSLRRGVKLAELRSPCCGAPLASAFYGYNASGEWVLMERTKANLDMSKQHWLSKHPWPPVAA